MLNKLTTLLGSALAAAFLIGLATTLTRSSMIGFWDVLPVFILMALAIFILCIFPEIVTWLPDKLMGKPLGY